jgi:hypothetical protein
LARVSARCTPGELGQLLAQLSVRVEEIQVQRADVALPDYPGGPRPSSALRLTGHGQTGMAEHVGFYSSDHERFAAYVQRWFEAQARAATLHVGCALGAEGTPYERAALEAALIDLALRQAKLSLYDLTGIREAALRFVASFAANADPQIPLRELRAAGYRGDFKVDLDPAWDRATLEALAREPSIVIVDFKGRGDARFAGRVAGLFPSALLEDPASDFDALTIAGTPHISRDATVLDASAVASARSRGESVNLKAPRMGGPLQLLSGLEIALQSSPSALTGAREPGTQPAAYFGGMFEVGSGREQARQLAALYCPDAPNDLAPNLASTEAPRANSPAIIRFDRPGFGNSA